MAASGGSVSFHCIIHHTHCCNWPGTYHPYVHWFLCGWISDWPAPSWPLVEKLTDHWPVWWIHAKWLASNAVHISSIWHQYLGMAWANRRGPFLLCCMLYVHMSRSCNDVFRSNNSHADANQSHLRYFLFCGAVLIIMGLWVCLFFTRWDFFG